jgi:cell division protein FtsW (lipid II flippase)
MLKRKEVRKMNSRSVRQFLSFLLMAVFFFVVFYVNMEFFYKIYMAALVFAMVFLLGLADDTVRKVEDRRF